MSNENNVPNKPVIVTKDLWRTYRAGTHQEVHAMATHDPLVDEYVDAVMQL
jgi:hypothetical protein